MAILDLTSIQEFIQERVADLRALKGVVAGLRSENAGELIDVWCDIISEATTASLFKFYLKLISAERHTDLASIHYQTLFVRPCDLR